MQTRWLSPLLLIALCVSILLHVVAALSDTALDVVQAAMDEQVQPEVTRTQRKLHSQHTGATSADIAMLAGVQPADTLQITLGQPPALPRPPTHTKPPAVAATAPVKPTEPAAAVPPPSATGEAPKPAPDAATVVATAATPPTAPSPATSITPAPAANPTPPPASPAARATTDVTAHPALDNAFPNSVDIVYIIKGLVNADHRWRVDGNRYHIRTTGSLFGKTRDWQSEGTIDARGLHPTRYLEYWDNPTQPKYSVDFDWDNHVARFGDNAEAKEVPLEDGGEDMFSAAYQFALQGDKLPTFTMQVFTGRKSYKVPFALKGEAKLRLSGQLVSTLVLAGSNDQKHFEFYLAPDWHNLPVRIYYTDGSKSYDLTAVKVTIDGKVVLERMAMPVHDH
ncbi:MAG: DUF3108 domain-containing protein [Burkholderiales bacterium]|nr:DUF3108 domain-containing protein [Burkholderiales bacterium]